MLAVDYDRACVDECERRMKAQLVAYERLVAGTGANRSSAARAALAAFEPLFFAHLTPALDPCFVHRTRALEGKDGNPLNEAPMLWDALLRHQSTLAADKTIKYRAEASVLKLAIGDAVRLDAAQFKKLSTAFLAEMRRRFV
ncbi:MAG TPA: hypothetical protein VL049_28990 [Candidatus Dormibacteraeota bacterium]|nr:hypothetical protein [Candidatus Dormibacteraeota bacterium]